MFKTNENILTKKFYDDLIVVLYNGPPNTICEKYNKIIHTENDICDAIKECEVSRDTINHIINPSDKVIKTFIDKFWYDPIHTLVKNPSKDVIEYAIYKNSSNLIGHQEMFSQEDLMNMINKKPTIIEHIVNPTPTSDMYDLCTRLNGLTLRFIPLEKQTLMMCTNAITDIHINRSKQCRSFIKYVKHFDENIADMIANTYDLALELYKIPNDYITKKRFDEAFETNHNIVKNMQYYPNEFLTDDIIEKIKMKKIYEVYHHIANIIDEAEMSLLIDDMLKISIQYITYVPANFQDEKMCEEAIKYNHHLLEYCHKIDNNTLKNIFNKMINTPKKIRFNFINHFDEDAIIRLIKIDDRLMTNLESAKVTDRLIKSVLAHNGYNLQYIKDQTQEYIDIALNNQPKAGKYVKTSIYQSI